MAENASLKKWNSQVGLASGTKEDIKKLNVAEVLKNKVAGKTERGRSLVKIFQDHNNKIEALLNDEFAPGTLEHYKTSLKHTVDFLEWKYNVSDIDIAKIDHAFVIEYEFYLRSVRKRNNNTAVKYIRNFGKIICLCIANGWLMSWTDSKTSLIELIYALHARGVLDNGKVEIKDVATYFEAMFNIDLGDYYRTYLELRMRKTGRIKFLNLLTDCINKKMEAEEK